MFIEVHDGSYINSNLIKYITKPNYYNGLDYTFIFVLQDKEFTSKSYKTLEEAKEAILKIVNKINDENKRHSNE